MSAQKGRFCYFSSPFLKATESPEPVYDLSECGLKNVPAGVYSRCMIQRKEALLLQVYLFIFNLPRYVSCVLQQIESLLLCERSSNFFFRFLSHLSSFQISVILSIFIHRIDALFLRYDMIILLSGTSSGFYIFRIFFTSSDSFMF